MSYAIPNEIPSAQAREHFTDIVNAAAFVHKRVIITRSGKKLAAIVPIEDIEMLEALEDKFDTIEALEALKEGDETIPWEKIKEELGL